jgi:hypothetical protein
MNHEHFTYVKALQYLGKKYGIDIEGADTIQVRKAPPRPAVPPRKKLVLPSRLVAQSMKQVNDTPFVKWLRSLPWDAPQRARIDEVLWLYCVGRDKRGWSLFWQINDQKQVLNGKLMKYRPDGHRDKGEDDIARGRQPYTTDWVHSRLKRKKKPTDPWPHPELFNPDEQEEQYTFFGMHLLNRYPKATINVVESEKTAIVCAIAYGAPEYNLWMACGGKSMLSNDRMEPLFSQHRRVLLYPDTDGIDDWAEWIKLLNQPDLTIQREFFTRYYKPELDGPKADIADILIRWMCESNEGRPHYTHKEVQTVADIIIATPALEQLIDRNQLPGALAEGEPFYTLTPLQQQLRDAIESKKKKLYSKTLEPNGE